MCYYFIQDGSISLSSSVEMMLSLQDLFFIDIISFWTSSIVRGVKHLSVGMSLIVVGMFLYW